MACSRSSSWNLAEIRRQVRDDWRNLSVIRRSTYDNSKQFTTITNMALLFGTAVIAAIGLSLYGRCTLNPMTRRGELYRDDRPGAYWFAIVLYALIAAASIYVHFHPQYFT